MSDMMDLDSSPTSTDVTSKAVETQRIISTGTVWVAAAMIAPGLVLGPLLAAGWRPTDLPTVAGFAFWLGTVAAAIGLALLVWAACPVLGFPLEEAYRQKIHSMRIGIVVNLAGMALAGLALLFSPVS
jgi:hypothetical protein